MTEIEAIKVFNTILVLGKCSLPNDEAKETIKLAIQALEKQIPKKPDMEGDGYADGHLIYDTWICPNCNKHYELEYEEYDYCPNCGQRIDWTE